MDEAATTMSQERSEMRPRNTLPPQSIFSIKFLKILKIFIKDLNIIVREIYWWICDNIQFHINFNTGPFKIYSTKVIMVFLSNTVITNLLDETSDLSGLGDIKAIKGFGGQTKSIFLHCLLHICLAHHCFPF